MRRTPCGKCGTFNRPDRRPRVAARASTCSNCIGTGFEPITAQPIHGEPEGAGVQADDTALTRFAITSRRVERVRAKSPKLAEALGIHHGDVGQRWALTDRKRIFSLYHMTDAGLAIIRKADQDRLKQINKCQTDAVKYAKEAAERAKQGHEKQAIKKREKSEKRAKKAKDLIEEALQQAEMPIQERIGVQAALECTQTKASRRDLFKLAGEQAADLYRAASVEWNRQSPCDVAAWKRLICSLARTGHADLAEAIAGEILDGKVWKTIGT
jgi:hypothetical protein